MGTKIKCKGIYLQKGVGAFIEARLNPQIIETNKGCFSRKCCHFSSILPFLLPEAIFYRRLADVGVVAWLPF
jgi:hypothetical protein